MSDTNPKNRREAIETAYGLLWMMDIDNRDPNLRKASLARQQLLNFIDKEGQKRGIERARWLSPQPPAIALGAQENDDG